MMNLNPLSLMKSMPSLGKSMSSLEDRSKSAVGGLSKLSEYGSPEAESGESEVVPELVKMVGELLQEVLHKHEGGAGGGMPAGAGGGEGGLEGGGLPTGFPGMGSMPAPTAMPGMGGGMGVGPELPPSAMPGTPGGLGGAISGMASAAAGAASGAMPGGSGDLVKDAGPLLQSNEREALSSFNANDSGDFQAFETALRNGDSTRAAQDLTKAVNSGKLDQKDAASLAADIDSTAKQYGGGNVSWPAAADLDKALGSDALGKDAVPFGGNVC